MTSETEQAAPAASTSRWAAALLLAAMVLASVAVIHQSRGTLAWFDEWDFIIGRRGLAANVLLDAHNGHLVVAPLLLYKLLLSVAGITHHWVFSAALLALHLLVGGGVFVFAKRRIGELGAAVAAGFVLFCFAASDDLIWTFQISFLMSVAFGVWMLVALDRDDRGGDLVASLCLAGALASAAIGIPFVIAAAVVVGSDERRWKRAWVVLIPVVLFAAWYLVYGVSDAQPSNLPQLPLFVAELGSSAVGGLTGLGIAYGRPLLLVLGAAVIYRLAAPRGSLKWLIALVLAALGLWALTALTRIGITPPTTPRYIYPGAVLVVLVVAELCRGHRLSTRAAPVAIALLLAAGLSNYALLGSFASGQRDVADNLRASLGALTLVDGVAPEFRPAPRTNPQISAGGASVAQRDFGTIALDADRLQGGSPVQREVADSVLIRAGQVGISRAVRLGGETPRVLAVRSARVGRAGACLAIRPRAPGAAVDVALAPGRSLIAQSAYSVPVYLRRFAAGFPPQPSFTLPSGSASRISAAADAVGADWAVRLQPGALLRLCQR
ncbi:MAG: hypothetical protein F2813_06430 [Actinobacteria bacterium]|uniref:Unannotated protein n=1 Tax=freshwater metagenome TaxID=449393 RepID=A0A6J5ZUW9_9ZZZZ|nr:hypothetical protein [Actinomycetota bacterium]